MEPKYGLVAGVVDQDVEAAEALDRRVDAGRRVLVSPALAANTVDVAADLGGRRLELLGLRLLSITLAPASANSAAIALPMPFDAPVTSATLPSV